MLSEALNSVSTSHGLSDCCMIFVLIAEQWDDRSHSTLEASPMSNFAAATTTQSLVTNGSICERYACGREYASRAIATLLYARSVVALNNVNKSSRSFKTSSTRVE